ncbi:MAG: hypothetical protein SFY69_12845 [Planctomycetota bacterium]|nr:hypothetical protein [Planctomycetota bacterium]
MRLPTLKPYRMFEQFDGLSDAECARMMMDARINWPWLTVRWPMVIGLAFVVGWPTLIGLLSWPGTAAYAPGLMKWVPLPRTAEWMIVFLVVTGVGGAGLAWALSRDAGMWLALKRTLERSSCRKCGQSLTGVPVQTIGAEPDPAKQFVRCPECGKKWVLLDIGLTPRDLVPFEQRGVPTDFARKRPREAWRAGAR